MLSTGSAQLRARQRMRFIVGSIVGYFELPDDTICAHIGNGEIVVLNSIRRQTLHHYGRSAQPCASMSASR